MTKKDVRVARGVFGETEIVVVSMPIEAPTAGLAELTEAEREVARRVLAGESNREIATRRGVSERTVANQVQAIFRKLGVQSRAELAALVNGQPPARVRASSRSR
jgi:DNA-binding NarL/FixJ family response regulator